MQLLFSHPIGNANVRALANGLATGGVLAEFHTSLAVFPGNAWHRASGLRPLRELRRRAFDPMLAGQTRTDPWWELARLLAPRLKLSGLARHETGIFSVDAVFRRQDRRLARRLPKLPALTGVYAYEDGALDTFRAARMRGLTTYYDLPIGYWRAARRLLEAEPARWPAWAATLTGFRDSAAKLARKDAELALADQVLVASTFTARTLRDYPGALPPVSVIPYGFPPVGTPRTYERPAGPLQLLFVGGLSQRKGIADLFAAVDALGDAVQLTVVGRKATAACPALDAALARHRWIPSLPHADVLRLMRTHDVLVFPSLFEGFGLVITEAMSQGTPVITTDRTAGPDLITHGENGWLVPAADPKALQGAIAHLLDHPDEVAHNGAAAQATAQRRPWSVYGREVVAALHRPHLHPQSV